MADDPAITPAKLPRLAGLAGLAGGLSLALALAACGWEDPDPEATAAAHAQILAEARHHQRFEGEPFSLIGSCVSVEGAGTCSESWERDEHRQESRFDAYRRPLPDPVVKRKASARRDCERREGSFGPERCPDKALARRTIGPTEIQKNVATVRYFYSQAAIDAFSTSCEERARSCELERLEP